jgi:hypothetical protein
MYSNNRNSLSIIENTNRRARSPVPRGYNDNHLIYDQTIYSSPIMALPQGWSRHISTNGRPFYFNASLNISQWNVPLPEIPSVQERAALAQRINELEQLRNRITLEIEQLRNLEN